MLSLTASAQQQQPSQTSRSSLKLVMTLLVRNEAEMIEANLDYHLAQGVDFVLVTDHGSTDGTDELLRAYERQGVASVVRDGTEGHHQSRRVTEMAHRAVVEYQADWIIHNDADEFWWPLAGSLRDVFMEIPRDYGQIEVPRVNFLPCPDPVGPFYEAMTYREARSFNLVGDPLESKLAHRGHSGVLVAPGNHSVSGPDLRSAPIGQALTVFHFPMRDYDQFERKVVQIGTGYETLADRSSGVGRDQLALLELQRRGQLRDYFDQCLLDEPTLRRRLEEGSVIEDLRLATFMREIANQQPPAARAAGQSIRELISDVLRADSAWRERLADVEADHAQALAREQSLHAQLVDASQELIATRAELERLRDSRTMRWTAPVRRRWHRLVQRSHP